MGDRLADAPCTAIVAYEVDPDDCDLFLESWRRANSHLADQPGLVSTTLHRATSANPRFRFVNVANWETGDAFRAATLSVAFQEASGELSAYPIAASVYEVLENGPTSAE
ncbi:MAG: antibiotic biosynthesis monooxygenase family protein [Acidimicrobiales bacterium]